MFGRCAMSSQRIAAALKDRRPMDAAFVRAAAREAAVAVRLADRRRAMVCVEVRRAAGMGWLGCGRESVRACVEMAAGEL